MSGLLAVVAVVGSAVWQEEIESSWVENVRAGLPLGGLSVRDSVKVEGWTSPRALASPGR